MPVKPNREYRSVVEIRAADQEKARVEGYATTFEQVYELYSNGQYTVLEKVDRHAFDECDMSDVIMQYDHEGHVFARTSNKTLALTVDQHGLKVEADLSGTADGRNLYEEIRGGYTKAMSFGFVVDKVQREEVVEESTGHTTITRTILSIKKLYDVSAVSIPANDTTEISARAIGDGLITEFSEEVRKAQARTHNKARIALKLKMMHVGGNNHDD